MNNRYQESLDPFATPPSSYSRILNKSVDIFESGSAKRKRRSPEEPDSLPRAIRTALDLEFDDNHANYDDSSILAAVSSAHATQELIPEEKTKNSVGIKEKPKRSEEKWTGYFDKNSPLSQEMIDDFMSPDKMANARRLHRQRPKQVRMDEYLFKARRIDKGAREFGLKTTHEPKRGSKKKRSCFEDLEVVQEVQPSPSVTPKKVDDFSLAFSPSPVRSRVSKNSKVTQFMIKKPEKAPDFGRSMENVIRNTKHSEVPKPAEKQQKIVLVAPNPMRKDPTNRQYPDFSKPSTSSVIDKSDCSVTYNDPSEYEDDTSFLDATVILSSQKTPDRLMDTVPMATPSPRGKRMKQRKLDFSFGPLPVRKVGEFEKRKQKLTRNEEQNIEEPIQQVKRQKITKREPTFDISSPINLSDDEDSENSQELAGTSRSSSFVPKRENLLEQEAQRKNFGNHVAEREKMIENLVNAQFLDERENGGIERRRAELQDGEVIRNKEIRKNLMHGTSCKCCRGYYDGLAMKEEEKKEYIDKVSRHRYVHQALPDTPEHYWDLTLGPRDEELVAANEKNADRGWGWKEKKEKKGIATWEKD